MKMTPVFFALLRFYNITLGRFGCFQRFLHRLMVVLLIKRSKDDIYSQASSYFSYSEIEDE